MGCRGAQEGEKGTGEKGRPGLPGRGGDDPWEPGGAGWGSYSMPGRDMTSDPSLCISKYLRRRGTCSRAAGQPTIVPFFCGEAALLRNEAWPVNNRQRGDRDM